MWTLLLSHYEVSFSLKTYSSSQRSSLLSGHQWILNFSHAGKGRHNSRGQLIASGLTSAPGETHEQSPRLLINKGCSILVKNYYLCSAQIPEALSAENVPLVPSCQMFGIRIAYCASWLHSPALTQTGHWPPAAGAYANSVDILTHAPTSSTLSNCVVSARATTI